MDYVSAKSTPLKTPEVVLNLWAYSGEDGFVMRIAGRSYVMDGDDKEKLGLLHQLSKTDFLAATWHKVPANFSLNGPNGEISGMAHASMLADSLSHSHLFGSLIESLAENVPEQLRSINGEYVQFKLDLPAEPLCVTTVVMEYEDGRLEPMISNR